MPHYLVNLRVGSEAGPNIRENARHYLTALRDVASQSQGQLAGCWSAFNGTEIVAVLRSAEGGTEEVVRTSLRQACPEFNVQVTELESLRETFQPGEDGGIDYLDPVDLGSDLSFPASDPPAWTGKY